MPTTFIYSKHFNLFTWWLNILHPFDGRKYARAWNMVRDEIKINPSIQWVEPDSPVDDTVLLEIHDSAYLNSLKNSDTISRVVEISATKYFPPGFLQKRLLTPLRYACNGTILATKAALANNSIAMNFGGGYHHTYASHGEGFCFFADAALAIKHHRNTGLINTHDKILMIDLDAHRGNGFENIMGKDPYVHIFDMYNFQRYPGLHQGDPDKHPFLIPLKEGTNDQQYLGILKTELTKFLAIHSDAKLVFYNAGNDVYEHDRLGGLQVSYGGVVERDRFVLTELSKLNIPTVIMTSGGYSKSSYKLIAELARSIINLQP